MFKIPKIEKYSFYIDNAMNSMQEHATKERDKIDERYEKNKSPGKKEKTIDEIKLNKRKDLELQKIRYLNERVHNSLKKIITRFPKFNKVDDIYTKLINTTDTKTANIQDAIRRIGWIIQTIDELTQNTENKLKKAKTQQTISFIMKKYLGKVNSYFKKNKQYFNTLEEARKFMNKLPKFEEIYTIAIAGFPNVGKSTLMNKLSKSNVEIQNYPFTTKGLMFGYLKQGDEKIIQMIDTPGLLNRKDKTNDIEERAKIVISQHSEAIIFVLDFTENCGYSIKSQIKLLKQTANYNKPITIYLSKTDLFDEEEHELVKENKLQLKKYPVFEDAEKLKDHILQQKSNNKKFNLRKINIIK